MHQLNQIEIIIGLLGVVTMLSALAEKLHLSYPIFLVLAGVAIGFIPGMPRVELDPQIVFLLFLPPLLYVSSLGTSWRDFKRNARSISLLAVGLVIATTVVVAWVTKLMVPDLSWAGCFVLGAIVSPPDAIAATTIARRIGIPKRTVTILEGESLVNDATGLVAYRFAVAAVLTGTFSLFEAIPRFIYVGTGGVIVGLIAGYLAGRLRARMNDNVRVATTLSLLTPFISYIPAEVIGVSGVLAVVTCGIYLTRRSATILTHTTRIRITAVWEAIVFMMNGFIFLIMGLQLPMIVNKLSYSKTELFLMGSGVSLAAIVIRMVWVIIFAYLPFYLSKKVKERDPYPQFKNVIIVGWTGMRGIVSLAAALALPFSIDNGAEFPYRDLIIFLTFAVIFSTLVLQGISLPYIVRFLKINRDEDVEEIEELKGRIHSTATALKHLEELMERDSSLSENNRMRRLRNEYRDRVANLNSQLNDRDNEDHIINIREIRSIHTELLEIERSALLKMRDSDKLNDETLRKILFDIDVEETHLASK